MTEETWLKEFPVRTPRRAWLLVHACSVSTVPVLVVSPRDTHHDSLFLALCDRLYVLGPTVIHRHFFGISEFYSSLCQDLLHIQVRDRYMTVRNVESRVVRFATNFVSFAGLVATVLNMSLLTGFTRDHYPWRNVSFLRDAKG